MVKATLVLEGGANRGVFTSGVLDYLMEKDMYMSNVIGVSAGACNAVDYVSKQAGRSRECVIHREKEYDYVYGLKKTLKEKALMDMDMLFDKFPNEIYPFDFETYFASEMECELVVTNCITGDAEYLSEDKDPERLMKICRASSSMPLAAPIANVDGIPYMDGGLADSIPIEYALEKGIPVYQPERVRRPECIEELKKYQADVCVVIAFGQILPKEILEMTPYGCINVHASLLPAYRGAAPIQWAVMNGDEVSGVTIMKMDEGLDTGDMLTKVEVPLAADETGGSLFDKLAAAGAKLLVETLPKLEKGEVTPEKQPEISTTEYARMIKKEDGKIDWTKSAVEIERQIRAMSPWPSAFTKVNGKNLKIWDAKVIAMFGGDLFSKIPGQNPTKSAGKVWVADETGLHVKTGDGILVIEELQLEGKKRMKTADFLRGYAIEPGTRLGE